MSEGTKHPHVSWRRCCLIACVCSKPRRVSDPRSESMDRDPPWRGQQETAVRVVRPAQRLTCRRHSAAPWPPSVAAPPSPRPRPRSVRPCPLRPGSLEGQKQRHRRLSAGTRAHATGQPIFGIQAAGALLWGSPWALGGGGSGAAARADTALARARFNSAAKPPAVVAVEAAADCGGGGGGGGSGACAGCARPSYTGWAVG